MNSIIRRTVVSVSLVCNLLTLLLDWQVIDGLTSRRGILVLTSNMLLSAIILCSYFVSIVFYEKAKKIFFILGLCSLSMLAALEISKFETFGYFKNSAIGVYLGVGTIVLTIILYIFLLRKKYFMENN